MSSFSANFSQNFNLYEYHGFQLKITHAQTYATQCSLKTLSLEIFIAHERWYFLTKIVLREKIVLVIEKKLLKFEDKGQEFAKILRSLE